MNGNLGQSIRKARKLKGWSLKTFSEKIGISIMTLQRIETGQVSPSVRLMIEMASHLERPITDFIKDKERTLIRLKSNRIKTRTNGHNVDRFIFPDGVIDENLGIRLAEINHSQNDWETKDCYQGYHVLKGQATLEFEDKALPLAAGETVYFDARYPHRVMSPQGATVVVINRR